VFYLEFILACCAAAVSLAISIYNIVKKYRTASNLLLAVAGFLSAGLFILIGMHLLAPSFIPAGAFLKIKLSLLLCISALFFGFTVMFPYPKSRLLALALASELPAYALGALMIATDFVLSESGKPPSISYHEIGHPIYLAVISLYLLASLLVIGYKAFLRENRAFLNDLVYLFMGLCVSYIFFLTLSFYPHRDVGRFSNLGMLIPLPLVLLILNYAGINVKTIDLKKFYSRALYWIIIFALLYAPVVLVLKFNSTEYLNEPIPPLWISLLLFGYLFLVFKYVSPRIENLSRRGQRNLVARVDELFTKQFSTTVAGTKKWDDYLKSLVNGIADTFGIDGAHFYLYNKRSKIFAVAHEAGGTTTDAELKMDSPLAELIVKHQGILYRPSVSSEDEFSAYRDAAMQYFEQNRIEVILSLVNPEKETIGFLSLGPLKNKRIYSKSLLAALELYRIQFQHQLANALMLEQVRMTQVIDHDRMVVNNVKKRIIPQNLSQVKGYRLSSLYINNSPYGGDYFDSVALSADSAAIFMSDSSYSGIDSSIISLELYTVLHTPTKLYNAPDKILGTMNWVMATSRFSKKYAPAYCVIISSSGELSYSNAAFKPLVVYNPRGDTFTTCDTRGVPVGVDKTSKYETRIFQMAPGSVGILCSDGLTSAINPDGEAYGFERVKSIVRGGRDKMPVDLTRKIYDDFNRFIRNKKQISDVSIILFKFM
jgi:serine phosphatase RsbU (regulator of sigma subunit)